MRCAKSPDGILHSLAYLSCALRGIKRLFVAKHCTAIPLTMRRISDEQFAHKAVEKSLPVH
jgi:hypothetical protein